MDRISVWALRDDPVGPPGNPLLYASSSVGPKPEATAVLAIVLQLASQQLGQIEDLTRSEVQSSNLTVVGDPPTQFEEDVDGTIYPIAYRTVAADADIRDKTDSLGRYV